MDEKIENHNTYDCPVKKSTRLRKLVTLLRAEENKLTLMKRIRHTQVMKENLSSSASTPPVVKGLPSSHHHASAHSTIHHRATPPAHSHSQHHPQPLHHHHPPPPQHHPTPPPPAQQSIPSIIPHHQVSQVPPAPPAHTHPHHPHHQTSVSIAHQQAHMIRAAHQSRPNTVLNPPMINNRSYGAPPPPPPPPLGLSSHRNRTLPAPGIYGPPASHHNQSLLRSAHNMDMDLIRKYNMKMNEETPVQRLTAAKANLKKQLEKTLLSLAPPKPPPPEIHFIPNANNNEFIYYYGLETIVDIITGTENKPPPEPFECVRCGSDFTPLWKWQEGAEENGRKPAVICEYCVSSSIKKKYVDEHNKRVESVFAENQQREKEIERRIHSSAVISSAPNNNPPSHHPPTNSNNHHSRAAAAQYAANAAAMSGTPKHLFPASILPLLAPAPAHSSFPRHGSTNAAADAAAAAALASWFNLPDLASLTPAQQSIFQAQLQQLARSLPPQGNWLPR